MTAIEWLFEKLWQLPKDKFTWYNVLEQAKKMEKQQIIDACNQPYFDDISAMGKPITKGEQYYDETFRGTMQKQALQFLADQAQELNMGYKKEGE